MPRPQIGVGYAFDTPSGVLDAVAEPLLGLEGVDVSRVRLSDLAGPNDVVQFISDHWYEALALGIGGAFLQQMVKNAADAAWKKKAVFLEKARTAMKFPIKLFQGVGLASSRGADGPTTAVVAVPTPGRNAGVQLKTKDPWEVAWLLGHLALNGEKIQRAVDLAREQPGISVSFIQNPDCSIRVSVSDDGTTTIEWLESRPGQREPTKMRQDFKPGDSSGEGPP